MSDLAWYTVRNAEKLNSPGILVYPDRVEQNIRQMITIAGSAGRLRPHVKTHKMPEVVKLQMRHGISKFKCSTIAEVEMVAECGAKDILLAMQPVGPNLERFISLRKKYPEISISCLADNSADLKRISDASSESSISTPVWLDINVGMNRTGIIPGNEAVELFKKINSTPSLVAAGFHVYDGHIHEHVPSKRRELCAEAYAPVEKMIHILKSEGFTEIKIVAGGTPSFPVHARYGNADLSPGTTLLWDYGYGQAYPDFGFVHAAVLIARIVSKPAPGLLCLDLGHKAVASEMPHPRVMFLNISGYTFTGHNEEHLVISTPEADNYSTGDVIYGIPWHICPTIDRHDFATVIRNNMAEGEWSIAARRRRITL